MIESAERLRSSALLSNYDANVESPRGAGRLCFTKSVSE